MLVVIVGAGPVGNCLVDLVLGTGADVVMVEPNQKRADACADRHDVRVLHADVADEGVADEAGFDQAHAVIATTTDDSTNLMTMFLAREHDVEVLTSTVNHSGHKPLFERLGVNVLADPEVLVAQHLLDRTLLPKATDVTTLQDKEQIIELDLDRNSPLAGRTLEEIAREELLPRDLFIVSIERGAEPFFPTEDTRLETD
ncbi:MAG TPA: TrkA family potassium uptake protein, partial [Gammaproteobacteria bacterium]|nr:TrkA family potassium uptake protein [Gammaproteobacteria bacterium]